MENVMSLFTALFGALNYEFLGMPLIYWVLIPAFLGIIAMFVRGKK